MTGAVKGPLKHKPLKGTEVQLYKNHKFCQ